MLNILERSFLKSSTFTRDQCVKLTRGLTTVTGLGSIDIEIDGNCVCSGFAYYGSGTMEFRYKAYGDTSWTVSNQKLITFSPPKNIYDARITVSGSSVCSGVYLYTWDIPIITSVSGITELVDGDPPIQVGIYNNSPEKTNVLTKILPSYTGDYLVDKSIGLTTTYNYDTLGSGTVWYGINSGLCIPEQISWYRGKFTSTVYTMGELRLSPGVTYGSWTSPVFYLPDSECMSALVYNTGNVVSTRINTDYKLLEVRASDIPPPKARFVIMVNDNRANDLVASGSYHKRIYMDDRGNVMSQLVCSGTGTFKLWRDSAGLFGNTMLKQYPNINEYGDAVFYASGFMVCNSVSLPTDETARYRFCKTDLDDSNPVMWSDGTPARDQIGGSSRTVIFTKPLRVYDFPGMWQAVSIVCDFNTNTSYIQRAMFNQTEYMWSQAVESSTMFYNTDAGYAACEAHDVNGFWVQMYDDIMKYDMVSDTPIATFDANGRYFRIMTATSTNNLRGFWGVGSNFIGFYNHTQRTGGALQEQLVLQNSEINDTYFTDLYAGAVDNNNNFWAVSISGNRVVRVNYEKKMVDFDVTVSGVVGVVPHATDGSAYILVVNAAYERIYRVNVYNPQALLYCATVSGFNSNPFKYGITFCGRTLEDQGITVPVVDATWGATSSGWYEYPSNYMGLPKGKYKQFRITLQREQITSVSPSVQKFRIPQPLVIDRLSWHEERPIYIKADIPIGATNGDYRFDLITWWSQE